MNKRNNMDKQWGARSYLKFKKDKLLTKIRYQTLEKLVLLSSILRHRFFHNDYTYLFKNIVKIKSEAYLYYIFK